MIKNIFENIPENLPEELFETLSETDNVTIEKIVSQNHCSPDNFWYDQDENEFVILLKGSAGLAFEGDDTITVLNAGDFLTIPAHVKHRVEWTAPEGNTVWLAVHFRS